MTTLDRVAVPDAARGDFGRAVLAEWTTFRTVRSSFWTLLISVALTVGIGVGFLPFVVDSYEPAHSRHGHDAGNIGRSAVPGTSAGR